MEVLKEVNNIFLNRKELLLRIPHKNAPTPSKEEVKKIIIEKFKVKEQNIDLKYIFSQKNRDYSIAKAILKEVKEEKKQAGKEKSENIK
jgi:ribosomal protein S24E